MAKFLKKLAVISAISILGLGGVISSCDNETQTITKDEITSLTIKNKDSLTKEWFIGDSDRIIELEVSPSNVDIEDKINDNTIKITSSNSDVISVNVLTLKALKVGKATITVETGSIKDSVEIEVKEKEVPTEITSLSIANKDELTKEWFDNESSRELKINFEANKEISLDDALKQGLISITSNNTSVIEINKTTLNVKGVGDTTISVVSGKLSDSINISIKEKIYETPTLEIETTETNVLENIEVTLPAATSRADGVDISDKIVISANDESVIISEGKAIFTKHGIYDITYKVTNPNDETKVNSKNVTYTVYTNWVKQGEGMQNANTTYNNPLTDNPSLLDKDGGCGVTAINIEASEYYYFETTIKGQNSSNGNFYFGLAHLTDSPGLNQRWLEFMVEPSSNAFRIIERYGWGQFSTVGGYENIKARSWFNDLDYTNFKMAIAREGDALYTFINDIYVGTYYSGDLNVATFPGIISVADGDPTLMTEGSGIEYTNFAKAEGQAEVKAKLDSLLGVGREKTIQGYASAGWNSGSTASNSYTNSYTEEKGISLDYIKQTDDKNSALLTNYVTFSGDFSLSFDYIPKEYGPDGAMFIEIRNMVEVWQSDSPIIGLGAWFDGERYLADSTKDKGWHSDYEGWSFDELGADFTKGAKYTLEARFDEIGYWIFTLRIQSLEDSSKVLTKDVEIYDITKDAKLFAQWNNINITGQYSNITWSLIK